MAAPRPQSRWDFDPVRSRFDVERMAEVPGIYFRDTPTGYHAHIEGTGLGVWEVVREIRSPEDALATLTAEFPWLTGEQRQAALDYYALYPAEIDERIRLDEEVTPEWLAEHHPELAPVWE